MLNRLPLTCGPTRARCKSGMSEIERIQTIGWDVDEGSGCWQWRGELGDYGRARLPVGDGRRKLPYRITYEYFHGPIADGLVARHKCDNPGCINPEHIEPGTQKDNVRDGVVRGNMRTISSSDRDAIRFLYGTGRINVTQLSRAFLCSPSTISKIMREIAA